MNIHHDFGEDSFTDNYFLKPGFIYVPDQSITISTVLGSGVSVCIYDREKQVGGMNHFQFPHIATKGKTTALYGNVATLFLLKMMIQKGSQWENLEAQLFGGAYYPAVSDKDIGRENIDIARKILKKGKIPVISEDVGGEKGRKVVFVNTSNEMAVLKVDRLRDRDWYPYE